MLLLLAALAVGVGAFARALGRPIPRLQLVLFLALAVLPFPRALVTDTTILPLDHARHTIPWMTPGGPPPHNPYLNDVVTLILPPAKATEMAWKEGEPPWHYRWNGCGMPLAANGISAALSPLTFLALVLPLARSYTLVAALKLLLAACGTFLWVRELGASVRSAAFAGTVFALSFSFTPPWLLFPQSAVTMLWPWMLFLFERLRDERGRVRTIAALVVVFVFTVLAGHSETAVLGFLFGALWLGIRWVSGDLPRSGRLIGAIALSAGIAVGLSAFLLIPSLYAIAASGRIAAVSKPFWEPILSLWPHGPQWRTLATSLFPHTLGNGIVSPTLPFTGASFPEQTLGYFGIVGWTAAFLFFRPGSRRSKSAWALFILMVCGWGAAVALWPFAEIFSFAPGLRYLFPVRLHSWEALAGSALAALELDRLVRDARERGVSSVAAAWPSAALGALAIAVYLRFRPEHVAAGGLAPAFQLRRLLVCLAVLALAGLLLAAARRRSGPAIAALTLLAAAELLYQWRGLFRLWPTERMFPETPLVAFLKSRPGPFRVAGKGSALFPNTNIFAGVEDIRTHDAVERRDYLKFLDSTCGYPYEYFKKLRNLDASALDFLNVRYLVTGPGEAAPGARWALAYSGTDGRVFENPAALERAFVPERVRFVPEPVPMREPTSDANALFGAAFHEITANANWRQTAWVLASRPGETTGGVAEISEFRESTNTASFSARVPEGTAWVVLSLVQDGGWSARDAEGRPVPVLRANGPFLALALPAGDHRIALRYRPPGFRTGAAIAGATAAVLGIGAALARARRRARNPSRIPVT
jgi:hypothetical protein